MMARAWRTSPALLTLDREIKARWPQRSTRSDGFVGDPSHQARASAHNPDGQGLVRAGDWTSVDRSGRQIPGFADAIVAAAKRHPSALLVIHRRKIWSRNHGWRERSYSGSNPHNDHVHVSILNNVEGRFSAADLTQAAFSTRPWLTSPGPPTTGVNPDNRTPIERLLDTMDEKTLRGIIRTEARNALYSPLAEEKSGDSAVDGSINNAIWHAARTVDTVALVREGVRQELWAALIPDHDGIPGSSIRNNLLHQTNASVSTLALVRQLAQREGVDVDEAAIVQGLTEALAPVIRSLVAEEAGDDIAERVVTRIGAALTQD